MKYTPEPWGVFLPIGAEHVDIRDQKGRRIAVVAGTFPMGPKQEDTNAERIVACVNACAGISTETLATGPTLAEVIRMRKGEYDKIKAAADRLAELMEWFCHRVEIGEVRSKTTYERFRAALAAHNEVEK